MSLLARLNVLKTACLNRKHFDTDFSFKDESV